MKFFTFEGLESEWGYKKLLIRRNPLYSANLCTASKNPLKESMGMIMYMAQASISVAQVKQKR